MRTTKVTLTDAMTEPKVSHTPGPWTAKQRYGKHGDWCVYPPKHPDGSDYAPLLHTGQNPESEANARLIAASPKLLDACRMVLRAERHLPEDKDTRYGSKVCVTLTGAEWDSIIVAVADAKGGAA